jgi:hypothetical protein
VFQWAKRYRVATVVSCDISGAHVRADGSREW